VSRDVDEYLALLPSFHRWRPNFRATVQSFAEFSVALQDFMRDMPRQFDLDEAIGVQLDAVGKWVGRDRLVDLPIDNLWFSFDVAGKGFDEGFWKDVYDPGLAVSEMDDDMYRRLLYAKIMANNWDGTFDQARDIWTSFFNGDQFYAEDGTPIGTPIRLSPGSLFFVEDKGDGSTTYGISGKVPAPIVLALVAWNYIPLRTAGTTTYYRVVSVDNTSMFGFDVSNEYVGGFDVGSWGVPPEDKLFDLQAITVDFSDPLSSGFIGLL
jgi:hypothetical protein